MLVLFLWGMVSGCHGQESRASSIFVDKIHEPTWDGWRQSLLKTWGLFKNVLKLSTKGMSSFLHYRFSQMWHMRLKTISPKRGEGIGLEMTTCFPVSSRLSTSCTKSFLRHSDCCRFKSLDPAWTITVVAESWLRITCAAVDDISFTLAPG